MSVDELTAADFFWVAYRMHLEGIGARLCPRQPFDSCDSPMCRKARAALRAGETA